MAAHIRSLRRKIWQALSSIKTGVVLLITVVVLSAAGTIVLQRPVTDPDEMQRAYCSEFLMRSASQTSSTPGGSWP
jgi:hypothetical protein